ncbi:putative ribonuclease H-like domain-containing protein [Tanacetum coccineum]|uniref:Ribonuclease H-like domain-containing protein n=1 Tax=Tanacetum coccineum TaxID=301880 RepID=A0ABQ5FLE0_9ASTR
MEPKKVTQALDDESWVEAMQEELLQFKLLNVWTLVDLPYGKKVIGTKWVFINKKDQRGIMVRNKATLVAQGHRQEEGIDYDEVFALVARIEAIRQFLAYTLFMGFTMYQMDIKSAFLYGTIKEEVYVSQPPGFVDPEFPDRVYKVKKALYGLHQAPKACLERKSTTRGCQFLGCRLIFWQCKKQTIVANSTTKAEYISASNCCGQVLWLQNQLLDYGYNFMQTKIHVDNESAICMVKHPVYHSKTKHIEIRHHFIRDSYDKKLIEMVKIHTDYNVADLRTKAFDVTRFQFLIASIGQMATGKTTTGKESSNPLMADSLPKTIIPTKLVGCLETITVKTVNEGEQQLTVIVDGQIFAITEASVRRHLQLADADGISSLPNTKIFDKFSLMGYVSTNDKLIFKR